MPPRSAVEWKIWALLLAWVVVLAGPQWGLAADQGRAAGVAIDLILDISPSMAAEDAKAQGDARTRLAMVKEGLYQFVLRASESVARGAHDKIGLVKFARYVDEVSPLTADLNSLLALLDQVAVTALPEDNGTATGDAIAAGLLRLRESSASIKAVILLTDGLQNAGLTEPMEAAGIAKALGIQIYPIGFGRQGTVVVSTPGLEGREVVKRLQVSVDEESLREVAQLTGGRYFEASDAGSVSEALEEITSEIHGRVQEAEVKLEEIRKRLEMYAEFREQLRVERQSAAEAKASEEREKTWKMSRRAQMAGNGNNPEGCAYRVLPPANEPGLVKKFEEDVDGQPPAKLRDVIEVAEKWPRLNFVFFLEDCGLDHYESGDPFPWCRATSRVQSHRDRPNVYVVLGLSFFGKTAVDDATLAALILGTWVKCLGSTGVLWSVDPISGDSWQAELLGRFEIPEEMRQQYGFAPLGPAGGPVKENILNGNRLRLLERQGV